MRRRLLLLAVLGGCGGDDEDFDCRILFCSPLDGPPADVGSLEIRAANPGGDQNCGPGRKAAWIIIQETPERLGKLVCVPSGTVPLDGMCTFGPVGETTGYDDCAAGLVCSEGACRDICSFDGFPNGACAVGTCTVDPLLFANGVDEPFLGVCRVR